jgi:hypothetical protein
MRMESSNTSGEAARECKGVDTSYDSEVRDCESDWENRPRLKTGWGIADATNRMRLKL